MTTLHAAMVGALAVTLFAALGGPSLPSAVYAPESRTTDLSTRTCVLDRVRGGPGHPDPGRLRCPGVGGTRVLLSLDSKAIGLGFAWTSRDAVAGILASTQFGPEMEWRGITTARGFEPYAALVEMDVDRDDGTTRAIAVLRVGQGQACQVGLVHLAESTDPNGTARRLADETARTVDCEAGRAWTRLGGF